MYKRNGINEYDVAESIVSLKLLLAIYIRGVGNAERTNEQLKIGLVVLPPSVDGLDSIGEDMSLKLAGDLSTSDL